MSDSTDFYEIDCQGIDSTSPTGRINHSRPRIAIIGGDSTGVRAAMRAFLDERYKDMIMADYSEIENRIVAHYPKDDLLMEKPRMEDMEKIYRYQQEAMKEVNPRVYLGEDGQRHGLGRKNSRMGSRVARVLPPRDVIEERSPGDHIPVGVGLPGER